jgi:hypothetical protein
MSSEFGNNAFNDYEERLLQEVAIINEWVAERNARGSNYEATIRKVTDKLVPLAVSFRDTAAYIKAPLLIIPLGNGNTGVGMGEVTGEIVGFQFREYPTIGEDMEEGEDAAGVVALVATKHGVEVEKPADIWDEVIPPEIQKLGNIDYGRQGVLPVIVPVTEGTRFTQVDNSTPLILNVSSVLSAAESVSEYNYRDYVDRIENLMQGRWRLNPGADEALAAALHKEVSAMCRQCPFLQTPVEVTSDYIRTPSMLNADSYAIVKGTLRGEFRRFLYGAYFPPGEKPRGTVMAIIYTEDIAALVNEGNLSTQEADKIPAGAFFVPLNLDHSLHVL